MNTSNNKKTSLLRNTSPFIANAQKLETKFASTTQGFVEFIREQGVVGLVIGFILGGSVSKLVKSLVDDIFNPLISFAIGSNKTFSSLTVNLGDSQLKIGSFFSALSDFILMAIIVYFIFKKLGIDRLDKKKEKKSN